MNIGLGDDVQGFISPGEPSFDGRDGLEVNGRSKCEDDAAGMHVARAWGSRAWGCIAIPDLGFAGKRPGRRLCLLAGGVDGSG